MPFSKEISSKCFVTLYDNQLNALINGKITAYLDRPPCLVINHNLYFPVSQVAKIDVQPTFEAQFGHNGAHQKG
jgi:hypothetical protein